MDFPPFMGPQTWVIHSCGRAKGLKLRRRIDNAGKDILITITYLVSTVSGTPAKSPVLPVDESEAIQFCLQTQLQPGSPAATL